MKIRWTNLAKSKLEKLDPVARKKVISAVSEFPPEDVASILRPREEYKRLRVDEWRVVFKGFIVVDIRRRRLPNYFS